LLSSRGQLPRWGTPADVIDTEGRVAIAKFPAVGSTYGMPRLGRAWRSAVECKILKVEIEQMAPAFEHTEQKVARAVTGGYANERAAGLDTGS
jgi:hypothetical protein